MTFDIAKLHRWQLSVATSSRNYTPQPPTLTINDFSPSSKTLLLEFYAAREWEYCEACRKTGTELTLKKCGGCGIYPVRRTLYCSRKCQRAHWAKHRDLCNSAAQRTRDAIESGNNIRTWKNCNRLASKRSRGLSLIITWAFCQVLTLFPKLNVRETCLSIHCRSQEEGKGYIKPLAYALEKMTDTPYGKPPSSLYDNNPGDTIGVVHLWIDGVLQGLEFADLTVRPNPQNSIPQWPWVLATIIALENKHGELAGRRLAPLLSVVTTLTSMGKERVIRFTTPENLDNGMIWYLYDWAGWERLFGKVIGF